MEVADSYLLDIRRKDRAKDMRAEAMVAEKTDEILTQCGILPIRVPDIDLQTKGVDFIIDSENERMYVDEKSANSCYNRDIFTYTIELTNICNKNRTGWFFNESAITTHYLFVWPRSESKDLHDIFRWEGMLIEKSIMKAVFELIGYTREELEALVQNKGFMKEATKVYGLYKMAYHGKYESLSLYYCASHIEKNVNLQFPKRWLHHFASRHIIWELDKGIVLNETKRPEIPDFVQKACEYIRKRKRIMELSENKPV